MRVVAASCVVTVAVLVFLAAAVARDKAIQIRLNPRVVMAGGAFWLTCRVARDERNRRLEYGVVDYRDSGRQLDGVDAPITFQTLVEHIPCDVGPAYCTVLRNDGSGDQAVQDFQIAGCNH